MKVTKVDYVLVVLGILLLPVSGIGLIPLGVLAWRIGTSMEKSEKMDIPTTSAPVQKSFYNGMERFQKTYKQDEYDINVLEDGR